MALYDYAEIYATLLAPEADLVADVKRWVRRHLGGDPRGIMDPACGPGTWLQPFVSPGTRLAGNDLVPAMVAEAGRRLPAERVELTVGDMRALAFRTGPFDLALNLCSSVGHLESDDAVIEHLHSVARHLRRGALFLLGVTVSDAAGPSAPEVIWQSAPQRIPSGGMAAVLYESAGRDPATRTETIRTLLLTKGVAAVPEVVRDAYELRFFTLAALEALLARAPGLELLSTRSMNVAGRPEIPLASDCGDVTLILRRR